VTLRASIFSSVLSIPRLESQTFFPLVGIGQSVMRERGTFLSGFVCKCESWGSSELSGSYWMVGRLHAIYLIPVRGSDNTSWWTQVGEVCLDSQSINVHDPTLYGSGCLLSSL